MVAGIFTGGFNSGAMSPACAIAADEGRTAPSAHSSRCGLRPPAVTVDGSRWCGTHPRHFGVSPSAAGWRAGSFAGWEQFDTATLRGIAPGSALRRRHTSLPAAPGRRSRISRPRTRRPYCAPHFPARREV